MLLSYAVPERAIRYSGPEGGIWYYNQLSGVYNGTISARVKLEKLGTPDWNGNGLGACVGLRVNPSGSPGHWGVWGGLNTRSYTKYAIIGDGYVDFYVGIPYSYSEGQTYDLKLEVTGSHATLYINGSKVLETDGITQPLSGLGATAVLVQGGASSSVPSSFLIDNWQVSSDSTPPATVTICGTVSDDVTNQPISNATVVATGGGSAQTHEDGRYEIITLMSVDVNVQASKSNYGDSLKTIKSCIPGQIYTLDFSIVPDIKCDFTPSKNGFPFSNPTLVGFCTGFTYTALWYYLLHIEPPPSGAWVWVEIIKSHAEFNAMYILKILEVNGYSPGGGTWVETNIEQLKASFANNRPCPLILFPSFAGIGSQHSVLAYQLSESSENDTIKYHIYVYDSTQPPTYFGIITVSHKDDIWTMDTYHSYTRFGANPFTGAIEDTMERAFGGKGFYVAVYSPVSIQIIDPNGFVLDMNSPDETGKYYRALDIDGDGNREDIVIMLNPKEGQYSVNVIPDQKAEPNDTYTLKEYKFGKQTVLAEDVAISDIPSNPYKSIVLVPAISCEQAVILLDYNLVDQNRISRTEFEYTFRLRVANSWIHDINDVTVRLIQEPNNTTVLDDTVHFASIHSMTESLSDDTFKIRTDRTVEGLKNDVVWKVCDCKMERKTDFNHDWVVNFLDFATFAQEWFSTGTNIPQDVYPDEKVDIMDIGVFADEWLK